MKKRIAAALAVLSALVFGVGCSSHSAYWQNYELLTYDNDPGYPKGYYWIDGVADMGNGTGELTICYLTLAEEGEAKIACSLARNQTRGDAVIYWESPEGELNLLHDIDKGGSGSCTLPEGTSRFLVRADAGKYDVGMGISGLEEENILYLDNSLPPMDEGLPPLDALAAGGKR